jgi:ferritin-like metal-binding protein YciE
MEKMNDLTDLLKHELMDLHSAEEQIINAMPAMMQKAGNTALKEALGNHWQETQRQKERLDRVLAMLNGEEPKKEGLLNRLFRQSQVCRGMKGLIEEGNKIIGEDMDSDVKDAAIIACAQKIEHYEISGYGTARSYARELNLTEIVNLLETTLKEEYEADRKLTSLAQARINKDAEKSSPAPGAISIPPQSRASRPSGRQPNTVQPQMELTGARQAAAAKPSPAGAATPRGKATRAATVGRNTASSKHTPASHTTSKAAAKTPDRKNREASSSRTAPKKRR